MKSWNSRTSLILLLCSAFAVRAGVAVSVQYLLDHRWQREFVIPGDANGYWELARGIVQRGEFSIYDPPRRIMRMPGFPLLLAGMMQTFGENFLLVRIALAGIGTAACGTVYLLGKELISPTVGLMACGVAAFSPLAVGMSPLILSETPFALFLLLSLWTMAKLVHANESRLKFWSQSILAGITAAAACYFRPSWLLVAPAFVGLWLVLGSRRNSLKGVDSPTGMPILMRIAGSVVLMATMLGCLLPWAYRNHQLTGHLVFTTLWAGPSLYDGLNPNATGASDMRFFEEDNFLNRMTEYEMDQTYRKQSVAFLKANPGKVVELGFVKNLRFWSPWPLTEGFQSLALKLMTGLFFAVVILLAVTGLWQLRKDVWLLILTLGPIFYFASLHSIFVGSMRYRLPAEYPLYIISAVGFCSWKFPHLLDQPSPVS